MPRRNIRVGRTNRQRKRAFKATRVSRAARGNKRTKINVRRTR